MINWIVIPFAAALIVWGLLTAGNEEQERGSLDRYDARLWWAGVCLGFGIGQLFGMTL